jgi:hypothetical protein
MSEGDAGGHAMSRGFEWFVEQYAPQLPNDPEPEELEYDDEEPERVPPEIDEIDLEGGDD